MVGLIVTLTVMPTVTKVKKQSLLIAFFLHKLCDINPTKIVTVAVQ